MPGVKGRSGRRQFTPTAADLELPDLDGTEDGVMRYNAAVVKAVATGRMDPRTADSCLKGSAGHLAALKQKQNRAAESELKDMLERAEKMVREGAARAIATRTGGS